MCINILAENIIFVDIYARYYQSHGVSVSPPPLDSMTVPPLLPYTGLYLALLLEYVVSLLCSVFHFIYRWIIVHIRNS